MNNSIAAVSVIAWFPLSIWAGFSAWQTIALLIIVPGVIEFSSLMERKYQGMRKFLSPLAGVLCGAMRTIGGLGLLSALFVGVLISRTGMVEIPRLQAKRRL